MRTFDRRSILISLVTSCLLIMTGAARSGLAGGSSSGAQVQAFTTADGTIVVGDVYKPASIKAPTVILLHMLGRDRHSFDVLLPALLSAGFGVVNMDLRGHGQSVSKANSSRLNFERFGAKDWAQLPIDTLTVMQNLGKLKGMNGTSIALVGSSIGANSAAMVCNDQRVKAVVLLSPGADYHGLRPEPFLKGTQKPVLVIAGTGDEYTAKSIAGWGKLAPKYEVSMLNSAAHGNVLLAQQPEISKQIITFLKANTAW